MSRLNWGFTKPLIKNAWIVFVGPVLAGVAVVAIVAVWHPWDVPPPSRTEIRLFDAAPYTTTSPAVRVVGTAVGSCEYPALTDPAPMTYRCFSSKGIYDPCFGGNQSPLICVSAPWSSGGFKVTVRRFEFYTGHGLIRWSPRQIVPDAAQKAVFQGVTGIPKHPWTLELATGLRCVFSDGATFVVAGQRANYQCGPARSNAPWVIGLPDQGSEPWVVSLLPARSAQTTEVAVSIAWY